MTGVLDHCRLDAPEAWVAKMAERIHFPTYYRPDFTPQELATIERFTGGAARRMGYQDDEAELRSAG